MLLSLCGVSALDLDTAESADGVSTSNEAELSAVTFPVTPKPGINLATGTSSPLDFEDGAELGGLFKGLSSATYVKDQAVVDITSLGATGNASGKALRIGLYKNTGANGTATATGGWHGIHLNMTMQRDRKYYIAADEYADLYDINPDAVTIGDTFALWSKGIQNTELALGLNSKEGKWYKQVWDGTLNHMPSDHFTGAFSFAFQLTSDTAYNAYVDNLMVVPYYKITYAGTETTTEWYLFDESGNIATTYSVRTDNLPADYTADGKLMTCVGWSEYQDGNATETVYLSNADVTLYPVWEEVELLSADVIVLGDEGNTEINATEDVTWSYDENSKVARVGNYDARTLSVFTDAEDVTGEFTVTATTAEGKTAEITIYVFKTAYELRPGLNAVNGTTKPMNFEALTDVPPYFYSCNQGWTKTVSIKGMPIVTTGNTSTQALGLTRNSATTQVGWQSSFRIKSVMEQNRPYSVSMTAYSDLYLNQIMNGVDESALVGSAKAYIGWTDGQESSAWFVFGSAYNTACKAGTWTTITNKNLTWTKETVNELPIGFEFPAYSLANETVYFDDILIMPYYKITYKNPDGTDAATVYALYDADGNILTEYAIDTAKVDGAVGYALSQEAADAGEFITSVPLENKDIVIYSSDKEGIVFTDGTNTKLVEITENFTFPTAEEAGVESANFIKWTNGSEHFNAGDTLTDASAYAYTTFTAFYQDASEPAMGFAFEGDGLSEYGNGVDESTKTTYKEYMEADGRDYYHVNMYNASGSFPADVKLWFNASRFAPGQKNIDGSEYTIFSYGAKILNAANLTDSVVTPIESATVKVFYFGSAWSGLSEDRKIGNKNFTVPVNEYFNFEYDMSTLTGAAWNTNSIANLIVEPVRTKYSFDVYFDYIRVYRKGLTTVTYDTNAPAGASVVTSVAPEKNRGVGTDYKLTGLMPSVDGYVFKGWSLTADGTETVEAIDLTGDTTVYAVWASEESHSAPYMTSTTEIRGNGTNNGIRFKSEIMNSQKVNLTEFGFITTREELLPMEGETVDYSALSFDFKDVATGKAKYAYGVSYNPEKEIDVVFGDGDNGEIIYTAVLTGIPLANKKEAMVVRSYAKYEIDGNEIIVYGNTHSASLYDTASEIAAENGAAYQANKSYIDSILEE